MGPLGWMGRSKSRPWVWRVVLLSLHRGRPQWPSAEMNWLRPWSLIFPFLSLLMLSRLSECALMALRYYEALKLICNLHRMGQDHWGKWPCSSTSQMVYLSYLHWGIRIRIYHPGGDKAHFSWERWLPNEPLKPRNDKADDLNAFSLVEIQLVLFFPLIFLPGFTFSSACGKTTHRSTK